MEDEIGILTILNRLRTKLTSVTRWEAKDKPIAIMDGSLHRIKKMDTKIEGEIAYV
jgi:hypothetical protein